MAQVIPVTDVSATIPKCVRFTVPRAAEEGQNALNLLPKSIHHVTNTCHMIYFSKSYLLKGVLSRRQRGWDLAARSQRLLSTKYS